MDVTQQVSGLLSPVVQYGFAGMCVILIAVIVWLIRQLIAVLKENNAVIGEHNKIMALLHEKLGFVEAKMQKLSDQLASRPCVAGFKMDNRKENES